MKFSSNNEWNLDYDLVIVKMIRWRILYKYRVSAEFAWWINYTFPGDMDLKKKKNEEKGRVLLTVFHFQKNLSLSTRSFQWNIRCFTSSLLKKKKKRNNSLCVHIRVTKNPIFTFVNDWSRLLWAEVTMYATFHGFPVKKNFIVLRKMARTSINKMILLQRWIFSIIFYLSIVTFHSLRFKKIFSSKEFFTFSSMHLFFLFCKLFSSNVKRIKSIFISLSHPILEQKLLGSSFDSKLKGWYSSKSWLVFVGKEETKIIYHTRYASIRKGKETLS